jgi:type II secretory pathway pseudopilin PulG
MLRSLKKYAAFSLFEILLVLVVTSIIAVSAMKYAQQTKQNNVADVLAQRMYFFSQAVRAFQSDHPGIEAGTFVCPTPVAGSTCQKNADGSYDFTGVTWLTSLVDPNTQLPIYLNADFTFDNLAPLELRSLDGQQVDDAAIVVRMSGPNITIDYGLLYDLQDPENAQIEHAISANAAQKATTMYDPQVGPSSFTYVGGLSATDGSSLPIVAKLGSPGTSDAFLRLDGTSQMRGDINVGGKNIHGVDKVAFNQGGDFRGIGGKKKSSFEADTTEVNRPLSDQFGDSYDDVSTCYLTEVRIRSSGGYCEIYTESSGGPRIAGRYRMRAKTSICSAECIRFR